MAGRPRNGDASPKPHSSAANFLGGATSGCISTLFLQPLDVVKTRLQLSPHSLSLNTPVTVTGAHIGAKSPGIFATFQRIVRYDSPAGLWRGVTPTVVRNTIGVGLYFVTLNKLSFVLARPDGTISDTSTLIAGASARSLAVCVLCPLSVVKTRLELAEYSTHYGGVRDALRKIATREGPAGLFSGLTPTIVRDAPYSALFVLIYLRSKEALNSALGLVPSNTGLGSSGGERRSAQPAASGEAEALPNAKAWSMGVNFAAGAFGGGLATLLTSPQDMVKTRMQVIDPRALQEVGARLPQGTSSATMTRRTRSVGETIRLVYSEGGVGGFFRGAAPRFIKRMLGSAITWMVFEETVKFYARHLPAPVEDPIETLRVKTK